MSHSTESRQMAQGPPLNVALHTKYWLRCLKTFLPTAYQEQDSSRIVLAFFILTSLDLLGGIEKHTTAEERQSFISFIYRCQHPGGGFRSFPGTDFGSEQRTTSNARWDPANIAGTYFAIASLAILGDDLSRVDRLKTLAWVRNLQREDGSFGDTASGAKGVVDGGQDVRFCFLAALICSVLGEAGDTATNIERTIDAEAAAQFIVNSQVYDGGIARKPNCESHAGSTYCGISTLKLLNRLPTPSTTSSSSSSSSSSSKTTTKQISPAFIENLVHWLSHRQTTMLSDYQDLDSFDSDSDAADEDDTKSQSQSIPPNNPITGEAAFAVFSATPALPPHLLPFESLSPPNGAIIAGFNGRVNKPADTCYSFWAGASLSILGYGGLIDRNANRRYLLEETQHRIGGFGKFPGHPPDILHSALALACLAVNGEEGLKSIDPILCVSLDVARRLESAGWKKAAV